MAVPSIISWTLTASISDDLPQILVAFNISINSSYLGSNSWLPYVQYDRLRFDQEDFLLDYFLVNWDDILLSSNTNTEQFYNTFLEKFKPLLDTCALLKNF